MGGRKKTSTEPEAKSPQEELDNPTSPLDGPKSPRLEGPPSPLPVSNDVGGEETPEQEAARRRATLARLRAGGALGGFNMFSPSASSPVAAEDTRGLEQFIAAEQEEEAPAPPVPGDRPPPPPQDSEGDEAEESVPPPPARRGILPSAPSAAPPPPPEDEEEEQEAPPPPPRLPSNSPPPQSLARSPSSSSQRPPISSVEKRMSQSAQPKPIVIPEDRAFAPITSEPSAYEEAPPIPPGRPSMGSMTSAAAVPSSPAGAAPRRSMSTASRTSARDLNSPASRTTSRVDHPLPPPPQVEPAGRMSMSGSRPGFAELQHASQTYGSQLARAAAGVFSQGKRGNYGVSSNFGSR